jgi:hypothetical protein
MLHKNELNCTIMHQNALKIHFQIFHLPSSVFWSNYIHGYQGGLIFYGFVPSSTFVFARKKDNLYLPTQSTRCVSCQTSLVGYRCVHSRKKMSAFFCTLDCIAREFSIQGEGDGTASAVVNQLWAWLF